MGSPKVVGGETESDAALPEANLSGESNASVPRKHPAEEQPPKEKKEAGKKDKAEGEDEKATVRQTMISTLLVSGVALAVIGVGFVVTKKLRESKA